METSTRFGAEDAKLHCTRSLSTAGLGFEKQPLRSERPPATPLHHCPRRAPRSAAARCPSTRGHLPPDPGRGDPVEAGNRAADTPTHAPTHARPPARSQLPPARLQVPATPSSPSCPPFQTFGTVAPSSPFTPLPCLRAVLSRRITSAPEPVGWGAPARGGGRRALAPSPGSRRSPLRAHSHYPCKVNPRRVTAARPRMCAFLGQAPQSPPSSAPSSRRRGPGQRRRRAAARASRRMATPRAERGGRRRGRAGPPLPLHFYRRRKRVRPGRRGVPASPGPPRARPAPARPGRLPRALPLTPSPGRALRAASADR